MKFKAPKLSNLKKLRILPYGLNLFRERCSTCGFSKGEVIPTAASAKDAKINDMGNSPYIFNIEDASENNSNFRTALWTGKQLQLVLMSIPAGGETGLEIHDDTDQFFRITDGDGEVSMGRLPGNMNYVKKVDSDYAFIVPAGTYHNVRNIGREPLKLYTIYAPPHHPFGTEQKNET